MGDSAQMEQWMVPGAETFRPRVVHRMEQTGQNGTMRLRRDKLRLSPPRSLASQVLNQDTKFRYVTFPVPLSPAPTPFWSAENILFPLEEAVRTYTSANQAGNVRASTALCSFLVLYDWCILQLFWVTMANLISQNSFMMCYYSQESICKTE